VNPIWGLSSTTRNQRALWPRRLVPVFQRVGLRMSGLHFVHRAWADGEGVMALVRRLYTGLTGWLPLSMRANKFLVSFDKTAG